MKSLKDKVAVVTGAGNGIGRALALELANRGTRVSLWDYNPESLKETLKMVTERGGQAKHYVVDVSDRKQVFEAADQAIADFGQMDIVVNNAGITLKPTKLQDLDQKTFERMININLWGVIYGTQAFLPHLLKRPEASLVNVSSLNGIMGYSGVSHYATAKFGVR
jgi:NAD(P)-dependent dehydrogenase (short-subunit alcohol dehydrogenase family)